MKWTDEQCWQIWCVIEPDPEEQKGPTRQMAIDYVRKWLGPWPAPERRLLRWKV